jgi:hypothetical protein
MQRLFALWKESQGSMAAMTAISLALFVGLLAVVTDLGHVHTVQNELRNAADAGALAGARALYPYSLGAHVDVVSYPDCAAAVTAAADAVRSNLADRGIISEIGANDIQYGIWDITNNTFTPQGACTQETNAVRVVTRKDATANNPVSMTFGRIFRQDMEVTSEAIAYISWAGSVQENQCVLPIGIPMCSEEPPLCPYPVKFTPDNSDTATWHTFTIPNASASVLRDLLENCSLPEKLFAYPPECPPTAIEVNNGQINSVLQAMWDIFIEVVRNPNHPEYAEVTVTNPVTGQQETRPAWRRPILKLSCGEGPCDDTPGSISDWKAVQQLWLRGVYCFNVYDMHADGRKDPQGVYPLDPGENKGYITGCVDGDCVGNFGGGGAGLVRASLPVLVK